MDNKMPFDAEWIGNRINATTPVNLNELIDNGFIEIASGVLADCKQSAIVETEAKREAKRESAQKHSKTLLPKNFVVSTRVREWAQRQGFDNLDEHLENFKLKAESKGYKYVNWDTAFMTAIRDNWAGIQTNGIIYETD